MGPALKGLTLELAAQLAERHGRLSGERARGHLELSGHLPPAAVLDVAKEDDPPLRVVEAAESVGQEQARLAVRQVAIVPFRFS